MIAKNINNLNILAASVPTYFLPPSNNTAISAPKNAITARGININVSIPAYFLDTYARYDILLVLWAIAIEDIPVPTKLRKGISINSISLKGRLYMAKAAGPKKKVIMNVLI